jgi:DivIVA domain-containing protein
VEIERHAIERRDFPLSRRGYDTASVDAHLRELANRVEELAARAHRAGTATLAASAGTQVQSIIATAESAAADIRRDADADAARTREDAVAAARTHVTAVSAAASALLERIRAAEASFEELSAQARGAAERLVRDLATLEQGVGKLHDAIGAPPAEERASRSAERNEFPIPTEVPGSTRPVTVSPLAGAPPRPPTAGTRAPAPPEPASPSPSANGPQAPPPDATDGDADSARLVALNMALGGSSRADTERYLAEHFSLADPLKLVDEVYAAIDT